MPGIRGASRACNTCKKRKISCDLQKPECARCEKAGLKCGGYERSATFVNRNSLNINNSGRETLSEAFKDGSRKKKQTKQAPATSTSTNGSSRQSSSSSIISFENPGTSPKENGTRISRQEFEHKIRNASVSASLVDLRSLRNSSNTRWPMLGLLEDYYVPDGVSLNHAGLYTTIAETLDSSDLFDFAVSATALTRCGQVDQNGQIIYQGTSQYVKAIKALQQSLKNSRMMYEDQTLAVCILLSAYELISGPAPTLLPWLSHMDGVAQLILMRGPHRHQTSIAHDIFLHFRASSALRGILTRQRSFLSEAEWNTIPFEKRPKYSFQHLLDLMFDLCGILEMLENEKLVSSPGKCGRVQIEVDFESLQGRYREWYKFLVEQNIMPVYTLNLAFNFAPEDEKEEGAVFGHFLEFPNFAVAQMMMYYWGSYLVLLIASGSNIRDLSSPDNAAAGGLRILEACTSTATLIAQAAPYCLQDRFKTTGPLAIMHTFQGAMQWFEFIQAKREVQWCKEVFLKINAGGSPFQDPDEVGEVTTKLSASRSENGEGAKGQKAGYQLWLPYYGKSALSLEF